VHVPAGVALAHLGALASGFGAASEALADDAAGGAAGAFALGSDGATG